jgi:hypothetical protein
MNRMACIAIWLSTVSIAAAPSAALAQAEIIMMALCKKITDDASRLKCYDAIPGPQAAAPEPKAEVAPVKQEWRTQESKSPIDDSPQFVAILPSEDGLGHLILRCAEHKTEAYVEPNGLFAWKQGSVLIRVNDLPPVSATWLASSDNHALFAPNGISFVKMLPNEGTLFIRANGHSKRADDATFKLGQVSSVRDRISSTCNWPDASSATAPNLHKGSSPQPTPLAPAKPPISLAPK